MIWDMRPSIGADPEEYGHEAGHPHLLREIVRTHQVLMAGFSREVGMPASHFALLRLLAVAKGDVGVTDLARQLGVNAAAVTRQLQQFERQGLVKRRAAPNDGRRSYMALSPKGRALFKRIHDRAHHLEKAVSSVVGVDDIAIASAVLLKLRTFIEGLRDDQKGMVP